MIYEYIYKRLAQKFFTSQYTVLKGLFRDVNVVIVYPMAAIPQVGEGKPPILQDAVHCQAASQWGEIPPSS